MHSVGGGSAPPIQEHPIYPDGRRDRSAQSKTAENLPIPRPPHIVDFASLSKTSGAG